MCVCVFVCLWVVFVHACVRVCVHVFVGMFLCVCARGMEWKIMIMVVGADKCSTLPSCIGQHMGMGWAMRETAGKCKGRIRGKMQFH